MAGRGGEKKKSFCVGVPCFFFLGKCAKKRASHSFYTGPLFRFFVVGNYIGGTPHPLGWFYKKVRETGYEKKVLFNKGV